MPEQHSSSISAGKYGVATGLAIYFAGFILEFLSVGLVLSRVVGIESGLPSVTPFASTLFGLGLVTVVAAAARAGTSTKYLLVTGAVIGLGLFFRSAPHEIHIASGIGFGLEHFIHIIIGSILITVSVVALAVLTFVRNRKPQGDRIM
ncbi:MAG: hypothetical protein ABI348_03055 [Nitrososphaera sp.]